MLLRRRRFHLQLAGTITFLFLLYQTSLLVQVSENVESGLGNFVWTTQDNGYTTVNPSARFLAYLPHSGFHNQRIELENAIFLSILLNRTLVLPLARLGANPLPYKPFDELFERYSYSDKSWLSHCYSEDTAANSTVKECRKFERYTHVSWQDIIDVSRLTALGVTFIERWNFRQTWFYDTLQVDSQAIYWLKDLNAYEMQFSDDDAKEQAHQGKYDRQVNLQQLDNITRSCRLLHLGSLFGSSRLHLSVQAHQSILHGVRSAMAIVNPYLNRLADDVVTSLGGRDTYFSVHIRLGDGLFAENAVQNSQLVWQMLLTSGYRLSSGDLTELPFGSLQSQSSLSLIPSVAGLQSAKTKPCRAASGVDGSSALSTPLFIATDAKDPRRHPVLQAFLSSFPCVFFLSDFHWVARTLEQVRNPLDNSSMDRFLFPFLDALVASRGALIIGTPESTFSKYIDQVLWRQYHN